MPRSHSSASLRSRSASALSPVARASLRYRVARTLLMASHISTLPNKDLFPVGLPYRASLDRGDHSRRALLRRMQIALEPAAKGLGMHRIFVRAKHCKYVTAESALKPVQV